MTDSSQHNPESRGSITPELPPPLMHFFYAEHVPEELETIWSKFERQDIIIMEGIFDDQTKTAVENLVNTASNSSDIKLKFKTKATLIEAFGDDKDTFNGLFVELASRIINSNKELYFIDTSPGSEADNITQEAFGLERQSLELYQNKKYEESLDSYIDFISRFAEGSKQREDAITFQLKPLVDKHKYDWSGKNVLVMQGALHTRVFHALKGTTQFNESTRSFNDKVYVYLSKLALTRKLLFGKPITPEEYKKAYLAQFPIMDAMFEEKGYEMSDRELVYACDKVLHNKTDDQINAIWDSLLSGNYEAKDEVKNYFH